MKSPGLNQVVLATAKLCIIQTGKYFIAGQQRLSASVCALFKIKTPATFTLTNYDLFKANKNVKLRLTNPSKLPCFKRDN